MSPWMFVSPGFLLKSPISLFSRKPAPLTTTREPKPPSRVYVFATAIPSRSTTEKWVVSSGSVEVATVTMSLPSSMLLVARDGSIVATSVFAYFFDVSFAIGTRTKSGSPR